jgi:Holliday junction resolvase RusA-like endonuclease
VKDRVTCYVAGPFRGDVQGNIERALRVAEQLREIGFAPVVPHTQSESWNKLYPHDNEFWMELCKAWQRGCDTTFRMIGASPGAEREVVWAEEEHQPVFRSLSDAEAWLRAYEASVRRFTVFGDPVTWKRPQQGRNKATGNVFRYSDKEQEAHKNRVRVAARNGGVRRQFLYPVELHLAFYRRFSSTEPAFGDADNHAKLVKDALNGIAYPDDRMVVSVHVEKHQDAARPRTEVEIRKAVIG